jgi:hypothetical protein
MASSATGAVLAFGEDLQLRPGLAELFDQFLAQQRFVFGNDAGKNRLSHGGAPARSRRVP